MTKLVVAMAVAVFVTVGGGIIRSVARTKEPVERPTRPVLATDRMEAVARDHIRAGLAAHERDDWDACVTELEQVRRPPAPVQRTLGVCYARRGDFADGVRHLTQATRLAPDDASAWRDLGVALRLAGEIDRAEDALARAITLRPDDARAHSSMGVLLLDRDELPAAVASLRRAVELDGSLPHVHANLALAYARTRRFADAEAALKAATDLGFDPQTVRAMIDAER